MPQSKAKRRLLRPKVPKAAFRVMWDDARRRYIALDDSGVLLGLSPTKGVAMGIARTAAIDAARDRSKTISVLVEDDGGKFLKQWTFAPPARGHG